MAYIAWSIKETVMSAFDSATRFGNTLEPYRQFYQENESLDLEVMKTEEHGTEKKQSFPFNLHFLVVFAKLEYKSYRLDWPSI